MKTGTFSGSNMKTAFKIVVGIAAAVVLVIAGLGAGWLFWGRRLWAPGMMGGAGLVWRNASCDGGNSDWGRIGGGRGFGMMGAGPGWNTSQGCSVGGTGSSPATGAIDIQNAQRAVEAYVRDLGYDDLEIAELMEFEHNFYAIVREHDTGIGAMELLVDKATAAVGPEMGPNMMWNARYGMHRRGWMMGGQTSETNLLSEAQALVGAQRWLDANRAGAIVEEHADPFYGYYTIHTMADGEIEGMLSVHGTTGQVWYHSWHGDFVQMIELDEEHG
jgi:hypothetical protein